MTEYEVLIDSDAFIGLVVETDAHHQRSKTIFRSFIEARVRTVTTNYVITEAASTLSRRFSQALAKQFLTLADNISMMTITSDMHQQASQLFRKQDKEKTSLVDMSNVVVMKAFDIPKIFAFDGVYADDFHLMALTDAATA